jgi:nicotinamidase-related amidase
MNVPSVLAEDNTVLVVIDIQDKLFRVMHNKERLFQNVLKLIRGVKVLNLPVILTEQYPAGLGLTLPEITQLLPDIKPVEKFCFSCCDEERFRQELESSKRKQVLIAGIEAHICVYQTAMDLLRQGYEVQVVADCVASRELENKEVCLTRLNSAGVGLTTMEMALFELLRLGKGEKFKQISNIVK